MLWNERYEFVNKEIVTVWTGLSSASKDCTMSSALTEANKDGHKLTCRAIATSILTGALGTILAVTFLSTVLTKCAIWTQFTAICAPVSCRHRNIHQNVVSDH